MTHCQLSGIDPAIQHILNEGMWLPVMEMFYSLQGEGHNTGKAAYFIRIGGCDVGCDWCDVKESWDATVHPLTPLVHIVEMAAAEPGKSVVITGGEPLMYNLDPLCKALKEAGMSIFLETSGVYPLSGQYDWICLSPKTYQPPRPDILLMADELKVIIHENADLEWAEEQAALVSDNCLLFLQPEWSQRKIMMPLIVDYVMHNPKWMVSLQTHKYMNIP